jgi:uncharacterized protein (TIGR02246 family)
MRTLLCAATVLALTLASATQAAPNPDAEVRTAFMRYDEGWRTYNVQEVVDAFSDNFDWVNSVGIRIVDKTKLARFLTRVFAEPSFRAGKPGPTEVESVRILDSDVAVVLSRQRTDGQIDTATNKTIQVLYTDEITVLKRINGRWLIISDLSSDEANGV